MRDLRAMTFVLGSFLNAVVTPAQGEALPSIFSGEPPQRSPAVPKPEAAEIVRSPLPLSSQIRMLLKERIDVAVVQAPPVTPAPTEERSDAIVMERFFVLAQREKKVVVMSVPSYLMKVFTTGEILEQRAGKPSINWGLREVQATGYGTARSTPRFELSASWRF